MPNVPFRLAWVGVVLIAATLACNVISGFQEDVDQARGTAGALATDAQEILTQAQGAATALSESGALQTARAFATQEGPAMIDTAQAYATEEGSLLLGTAQALATEAEQLGYLETARAFVTLEPDDMLSTLQALTTQADIVELPPFDIPVVGDTEITDFHATDRTVSYFTKLDLVTVMSYYQQEMPVKGWQALEEGRIITSSAAVLPFEKPDRLATVSLSADPQTGLTAVLITILPK